MKARAQKGFRDLSSQNDSSAVSKISDVVNGQLHSRSVALWRSDDVGGSIE